jgi:Bacterial HORMA domain family 1
VSSTGTQTTTFTVADIRKVVENFAADFSMMSQATGLRTRDSVADIVYDLRVFAEYGHLVSVRLILRDSSGNKIRGALYRVSESASGWTSEQPGNNLWPKTQGGSLNVVATMSSTWWSKTDSQKTTFISNNELNGTWPVSAEDESLDLLSPSAGQKYASRGYGWERTNYSK